MFALLANGAPAPFLGADSPAGELAVWGGCVAVAAALGGWGLWNVKRPGRDAAVGTCLFAAMVLTAFATLFALSRNHERQMERNRIERERYERELEERDRGSTP